MAHPIYTDGYEIRYNRNTDQFECWNGETLLSKKGGKPATYKAEGLAVKFMANAGAQVVTPQAKKSWTPPPEAATIAPLAEQLASLPADAPRFVLIEAAYGFYKEQGYACYDREKKEIVNAHTYNGWNEVTQKREDAEVEVAYRNEHGPTESAEPDLYIFNAVFGEEIRRSGDYQPEIEPGSEAEKRYERQKAYWESRTPAQPASQQAPIAQETEMTFVTDRKYAVGETFTDQSGETFTVVEASFYLSQRDVDDLDDMDAFGFQPGWQTKARKA